MPPRRKKRATPAAKWTVYNSAVAHVGLTLSLSLLHYLKKKGLLDKDDLSGLTLVALTALEQSENAAAAADRNVFVIARRLTEECLSSLD